MSSTRIPATFLLAVVIPLSLGVLCDAARGQDGRRQDGRRQRSSWRQRTELKHLVFKSDLKYESKAKRGGGIYSIYLPIDYDAEANEDKRYPVVYFLHGMREDHNRFNMRGGAGVLDRLVGKEQVPALIFVCAYDGSRSSFYVNTKRAKVEDMIVRDLVAHVDKKYRTLADRANRALLGVSMGGFGAMKIAFKHPAVFGIVATHSAAILPEKYEDLDEMFPWASRSRLAGMIFGDPVDEKLWEAENPLVLARTTDTEKLNKLRIYFDCGDRDRYGFAATNRRLHEMLKKRKVAHSWSLVKGGGHGWNTRSSAVGYNTANLPNSLRFIASAWAQKKGIKALGNLLGGKRGGKSP